MTIRISWFCQEEVNRYLLKTDEIQINVKLLNHYFTLKVLFNANFSIKISVSHLKKNIGYWKVLISTLLLLVLKNHNL